jgi:hypothetical protein
MVSIAASVFVLLSVGMYVYVDRDEQTLERVKILRSDERNAKGVGNIVGSC